MPPTNDTTTNNGFPYPTDANDGTDFATGIADFAGAVDGMWSSGTLASRPTAGTVNRIYYATDTGLFYKDTGSAWQYAGGVDTGWVTLTIVTGTAGSTAPAARRIGNQVNCRGLITAVVGGIEVEFPDATWGPTVPSDFPLPLDTGTGTVYCSTIGIGAASKYLNQPNSGLYVVGNTYSLCACNWLTN